MEVATPVNQAVAEVVRRIAVGPGESGIDSSTSDLDFRMREDWLALRNREECSIVSVEDSQ